MTNSTPVASGITHPCPFAFWLPSAAGAAAMPARPHMWGSHTKNCTRLAPRAAASLAAPRQCTRSSLRRRARSSTGLSGVRHASRHTAPPRSESSCGLDTRGEQRWPHPQHWAAASAELEAARHKPPRPPHDSLGERSPLGAPDSQSPPRGRSGERVRQAGPSKPGRASCSHCPRVT